MLLDAYPHEISNVEIADRAGFTRTSSSTSEGVARLRALGLVDRSRRMIAEDFWEATR